ncbi:MAG TPA: hypothetical protein VIY48_18305 [Candidatus Paceibacterota bacterium]
MTTFADIVAYLIDILNQLVFVLAGLAVVVFLWGMVKYVRNAAVGKRQDKTVGWSLIALFVIFSVWGLLRLMCVSFGNICSNTTSNQPTNIVPAGGAYNYSGPTNGNSGGTAGNLNPIY